MIALPSLIIRAENQADLLHQKMPLSYDRNSDRPDVFVPSYTSKRKKSMIVSSNEVQMNQNSNTANGQNDLRLFDKEQLAKLLIHALKELGYNQSSNALQEETGGIQVESAVVQKLFNIIRSGNYENITVSLLCQLPLKYGSLNSEHIAGHLSQGQPPFNQSGYLGTSSEDNSMKIENIIVQGTDWQRVIAQMQQELKNFESILPVSGKSFDSQIAVQLISLVEIMVLINREIFLELVFDQQNPPIAVLFLRNILRKYIQLWDSLLSLENHFLDKDTTFTPDNLLREMTTILTSPFDSNQRNTMWHGSLARSRETLIEEISDYINPNDLVPKGRLLTLLKQAITYQQTQEAFSAVAENEELATIENGEQSTSFKQCNKKFNLLQDNISTFQQIKFVEEKTLIQNVDEIWYLQFSPDGKYLASASADSLTDRKIMIYDVENDFQVYKVLAGNDQCVLYLSFSPDSRYVVSCPFNEMANVYDIHSKGESTNINPNSENGLIAEVIAPINTFQIPSTPGSPEAASNNCGGPPRIWCCDWFHTSDHKGRFVVGSPDREVAIYDMNRNAIILRLSNSICPPLNGTNDLGSAPLEPFPRVHDLKITADDNYLILMTHQGNIDVYDLTQLPSNEKVEAKEANLDKVLLPRISRLTVQKRMTCISLPNIVDPKSPLASLLLVSLQSNELQLWDFKEQILVQKFFGQRQEQFIIRSCFGYNNELIASGSEDGKIYIWDRINGNIVGVLTAHVTQRPVPSGSNKKFGKNCNVVAWSPTNKALCASGGDDGYIKIWRVGTE